MKTWAISLCLLLIAGVLPVLAQGTLPINIVVSVEARHGKTVPVIHREDVRVREGNERLQVTEWTPVQGAGPGLQLLILVDDTADTSIGSQFDDVRKFITAQPEGTSIAVGYIHNGGVTMAQDFTTDHSLDARALRLPQLSGESSPYTAITERIKRWPHGAQARQILLISNGIDWLQEGINDPYLDEAIEEAQRAGVQVSAIYASPSGHYSHSLWRTSQGQNNLSRLADETGGETYFQGLQTPVSFGPYLDQFAARLQHQFILTFLAHPGPKAEFRHIQLETEVNNAELVSQDRVWVPAAR